jgi:hypothetical protein
VAAIDVLVGTCGRIAAYADVTVILIQVSANGAVYATASGGLPFDLTAALTGGAQQFDMPYFNPGDVVGLIPLGLTGDGFVVTGFATGVPTYTAQVGSGYGSAAGLPPAGTSQGFLTDQTLTTFPCTVRFFGTGAANHGALGEVADGASNSVFQALLFIARGGVNK